MDSSRNIPIIRAPLSPADGHQRMNERYALVMSVTLQVMIPEDTFRPQILNGLTVDVSERGMQVSIAALPLNLYSKLLSRPRNVRVAFDPPGGGDEIKLLGRISWIDYRKPKADERAGPCRLGVFFDAKDGCDLKPYSQFIAAIDPA